MMERLRLRVHDLLQIPSAPGNKAGTAFNFSIAALIVLNVFAVIAETLQGVHERYGALFRGFEVFSVTVFIVEYALRWWSITADPRYSHPVTGRLRWMTTPFPVIDIIAIVPAFIGVDLRFVRLFRVLRVLKLGRYSQSMDIMANVWRRSRSDILTSAFLVGLALVLTSSLMYYAERDAQPNVFSSIPKAMYWSIVTLTTVGYGDITPITTLGRVIAGATALLGVASIALPIGILSSSFVQEVEQRRRRNVLSVGILSAALSSELEARHKRGLKKCPHCGTEFR